MPSLFHTRLRLIINSKPQSVAQPDPSDPLQLRIPISVSVHLIRFLLSFLLFPCTFSCAEMNGMQNRKVHNMEKPFPGCLGRMVNLFDLSPGVSGNRLLTDKPHGDGSSLSRSQSDVSTMLTPCFGDHIEEKLIVSELSRTSYNKVNGTPMKMLIAQELSKEGEAKCNSPNLVAKLMGLDYLPQQQSDPATIRSHSKGYSRRSLSHSSIPSGCWQQEDGFVDKGIQSEYMEESEPRDIHEIWLQSQKANNFRDKSPQKRHSDNINEKKMALVHQKFMEAKRLATDEKLRQSKEFQEALEVLSSNKDLFLKFLQEPNSLFSQHLYGVQSIPPPPETNRITVLRPSKMADEETLAGSGNKNDKQVKKPAQAGQVTAWEKSNKGYPSSFANQNTEEYPSQPTRIVVLKPTLGKSSDIKTMISPLSMPSRILRGKDSFEEPEDEARESRKAAKEITQHMRDNLMGYRRDETLLSVFSNGYVGDESSFNKSEDEYAGGNLSDSEVTSPTSRHSWDYLNRFGSPYSPSSFSRASCSPESSVCREAKKRLSERWAMMASSGGSQEQRHVRRGSSTLGEMLALSDSKKLVKSEDASDSREQKPRGSTSILSSNMKKEDGGDDSPINLLRSKSLPVSSTIYGARLNVEASDSEVGKSHGLEELTRAKSTKSSLRGKVSKLFFSRSKRLNIERSSASQSINESQSSTIEAVGSLVHPHGANASPSNNGCGLEECLSPGSCIIGHPDFIATVPKQTIASQEGVVSVVKSAVSGNINENLNQPSPISVLEPPFEEDDSTTTASSSCSKPDQQGMCGSIQSNLIDKSPLIGSVARTLSWDDSCTETATPYPLDRPSATTRAIGEEQEWLASVRTVLSAAGLDGEVQWDSLLTKWYSPESPLDPSLRDKYTNSIEEPLHEGKRRQRRSSRKLVFDCVNEALAETTLGNSVAGRECWSRGLLEEHVWGRMKELMYREDGCDSSDGEEEMVVDRAVRREMMGRGWNEKMREEGDNVGKEIQGKLLQELVEEVVVDFTFTNAFPFSSSSQFIL